MADLCFLSFGVGDVNDRSFGQLAVFHKRRVEPSWKFTANDVVAFSRHKRDNGMPEWKRQRMVDGLMAYRRIVPLPINLIDPLRRALESRKVLHKYDVADGVASVWLLYALAKKYPSAASEWRWQFVFASDSLSRDPRTHAIHRHHLHRDTFPRHLRNAVENAGSEKAVTSHTFRHSFASPSFSRRVGL